MRKIRLIWAILLAILSLNACVKDSGSKEIEQPSAITVKPVSNTWDGKKLADITYQILVYSFADSDGDGYGDFNGITQHLDYIDSLGAKALWLSPIFPSMSYHGYDVTDYSMVNPKFGTESDFKNLVSKAHAKDIKIYLDFVLNHTGKDHPWFKSASSSKTSPYRNYYIFSSTPQQDIISGKIPMIATEGSSGYDSGQWFRNPSSTWGTEYYHSHFWTDWFADLNYGPAVTCENSEAFKAVTAAADKWIGLGVDGFRLDAVKHIYHNASSDENPTFLKKFYDHCNTTFKSLGHSGNIYMVGEVLDEASSVAHYYSGLPAFFEFSFWYRLSYALNNGIGRYFAKDILGYLPLYKSYRTDYIEATKLSNHDENRTGSELGGSIALMKQAAAVLLTSGGHPYIYQGEELGYTGKKDGGDEYVRTPIMWDEAGTKLAKAGVNNKVNTSMLKADISVEAQRQNPSSVLEIYRYFTRLRNQYPALAEGVLSKHPTYNDVNEAYPSIAAWYLTSTSQKVLVIHNFGTDIVKMKLTDDLSKPLGLLGKASVDNSAGLLYLNGNSSVIFEQ